MTETITAPPFGTPAALALGGRTVIDVSVVDVGTTETLPKVTRVAPVKPLPEMVIVVVGASAR